jgi:hypothetical protein
MALTDHRVRRKRIEKKNCAQAGTDAHALTTKCESFATLSGHGKSQDALIKACRSFGWRSLNCVHTVYSCLNVELYSIAVFMDFIIVL